MSSWLTSPVQLEGSRAFTCDGFTQEQCEYYRQWWHFWYQADHAFALPTVAFFMSAIGIFIVSHLLCLLAPQQMQKLLLWRRIIAAFRYLSYRGFRVERLQWNSAAVGQLLLALIGTTFFFCMDLIPSPYYWSSLIFGNSPPLGTRSGWMALACMPFVFATASKANWITLTTGVSHEKLQLYHRWISYAFFILALMHTFPFIVYHIANHDMVYEFTQNDAFIYITGVIALLIQAWLTIASFGWLRNLRYEFFKAAHFFAVMLFVLIFFWHCDHSLTSWNYFIATAAVYVPCLLYSWARTFVEYGTSQNAELLAEECGFLRLTIQVDFEWVPGQHCFLRFRGFGMGSVSSHPFTICSLPSSSSEGKSTAIFYVRSRNGFTKTLWDRAVAQPRISIPVLIDGPYGGIDLTRFFKAERLIVIAGGSGAGWSLPFLEQFGRNQGQHRADTGDDVISKGSDHLPRTSSLRLILATREASTLDWYCDTVDHMISRSQMLQSDVEVKIETHLTGEEEELISGSSSSVNSIARHSTSKLSAKADHVVKDEQQSRRVKHQHRHGRPDLPSIIADQAYEAAKASDSIAVFVCGPGSMQDDVRNAVAKANLNLLQTSSNSGGIYLHLEHFSWA